MNQIILIMLCRNGGKTSLHQLSSENQYNYFVQAVLRYFTYCKLAPEVLLQFFIFLKGCLLERNAYFETLKNRNRRLRKKMAGQEQSELHVVSL